jgi:hypothetical protein
MSIFGEQEIRPKELMGQQRVPILKILKDFCQNIVNFLM